MSQALLEAQFPRQPCCQDRTYSRLIAWCAYQMALPMPPTDTAPDSSWVRSRILAARFPANMNMYVQQVMPYLLQDPTIRNNIRTHLSAYNDDAVEAQLATDIDGALAVLMPRFAEATVPDEQVRSWCQENGYPIPPDVQSPSGAPLSFRRTS